MAASNAERIAIVRGADSATVQTLFEEAVTRWRASDIQVVGLIEEQHGLPDRTCNAGMLRDIVSGEPYIRSISKFRRPMPPAISTRPGPRTPAPPCSDRSRRVISSS